MVIKTATKLNSRSHRELGFALLLGAGLCASPALQAQNSESNATASADNVSALSNAQSGIATATSEASGGQAFASGGNSTVVTEITQNFEASKNPGRPEGLAPLVQSPALFRPPQGTLPGTAASVVASIAYIDSCGLSLGGIPTREVNKRGDSGKTEIAFLPHYNYLERQQKPPPPPASATPEQMEQAKQAARNYKPASVQRVAVQFPKVPVAGECLGMLSAQSREKKANKAYFFTLLNDAMEFAKNDLRGYPIVNLLCGYRTIATAVGAGSAGLAGALSPGLGNLTSSFVYEGLLGGLTGSKGRTFPHTQLGVTCIVAAEGGTPIDVSMLNRGGQRHDPSAISEAIDRKEEQDTRGTNGNGVEEKAAAQFQQNVAPMKQELQQPSSTD